MWFCMVHVATQKLHIKTDTHEIEEFADLMARLQTKIIYHNQRDHWGISETHLSLFENSTKQILARNPWDQLDCIETVSTSLLMINWTNFIPPIPQDENIQLVYQLGKIGILRKLSKTAKAPAYITEATPPRRNLLTIHRNPQVWNEDNQCVTLSPQNQYTISALQGINQYWAHDCSTHTGYLLSSIFTIVFIIQAPTLSYSIFQINIFRWS